MAPPPGRWASLPDAVREAPFGPRGFERFRVALALRSALSGRLKWLTRQGILRQFHYGEGSSGVEYRLTQAGLDLYPGFNSLMQFGDHGLTRKKGPSRQLVHAGCGMDCKLSVACSSCLELVVALKARYRAGSATGRSALQAIQRSRRAANTIALHARSPKLGVAFAASEWRSR
ncbi:MAG: winged helix-turn-helix transcriptional regulator [Hyphomicrobiaceae bacterium]|nr:winged helix-turn-helix transcriptional regulator [Hyphomicrobiaceae bacterium]